MPNPMTSVLALLAQQRMREKERQEQMQADVQARADVNLERQRGDEQRDFASRYGEAQTMGGQAQALGQPTPAFDTERFAQAAQIGANAQLMAQQRMNEEKALAALRHPVTDNSWRMPVAQVNAGARLGAAEAAANARRYASDQAYKGIVARVHASITNTNSRNEVMRDIANIRASIERDANAMRDPRVQGALSLIERGAQNIVSSTGTADIAAGMSQLEALGYDFGAAAGSYQSGMGSRAMGFGNMNAQPAEDEYTSAPMLPPPSQSSRTTVSGPAYRMSSPDWFEGSVFDDESGLWVAP